MFFRISKALICQSQRGIDLAALVPPASVRVTLLPVLLLEGVAAGEADRREKYENYCGG
jgi:hypothetical protein